jgi:hypothetical protein
MSGYSKGLDPFGHLEMTRHLENQLSIALVSSCRTSWALVFHQNSTAC